MGEIFANPLTELAEYTDMRQDLERGRGPIQICGVTDSQKVHVMHVLSEKIPWKLVVTHDDTRARELFEDFSYFCKNTWLYPARDLLFYSSDIHGNLLTRQRMQVFRHLMEDEGGIVVTTVDGLMDHLLPLSMLRERCLHVEAGSVLDVDHMKEILTDMGYERMGQVDGMGQFSIRGGIIDIYPLTEELPVRIELWDDEVDSIRSFDPESQRSVTQMDTICIYPAAEMLLTPGILEEGLARIEADGKKQERSFRDQKKAEEAHRIRQTVNELCESLREGFAIQNLDGYIRYFCKDTVSFLGYMEEAGRLAAEQEADGSGGLAVFLDEPQRLKEKAETVAPDTEKEDDEKEPQPDEDADEDADEDEDRNGAAVDPLGQVGNRGNVRMPLPHLRFATPAPFVVHYSITRVPSASREVVTVDLQTNFNGTSYCHIMSQEGADGPIR